MATRRRAITLVGSTALLATAGCASISGDDDPEHREDAPPLVDFSIHIEGPDGEETLFEPADVASVGEVDEDDIGPHVPVQFTNEAVDDGIETYADVGGTEMGENIELTVTIAGDVEKHETYAISPELASTIHKGDWDGEFLIHTDSKSDAQTLQRGLEGGESE